MAANFQAALSKIAFSDDAERNRCKHRLASPRFSNKMLASLLLFTHIVHASAVAIAAAENVQQIETNEIDMFLKDHVMRSKSSSSSPSARDGLPDATAIVGRLFTYPIPESNQLDQYKIVEAGKDRLPRWLHLDESGSSLQGVPASTDRAQIYIQVSSPHANTQDIFSISVMDEDSKSLSTSPVSLKDTKDKSALHRCLPDSSITLATVIIDSDISKMNPKDVVGMMQAMQKHLNIDSSLLKLSAVGDKTMFDSTALVAGPGDVKQPHHAGATVQWRVGCGSVEPHHLDILQNVEASTADGSMATAIGYGIIGWHVTNNRPHSNRRLKRQAIRPTAMATLLPATLAPTKLTGLTVAIESTIATTATDLPMTRKVPAMESPSFPVRISPSTTHTHHRTKTHGRHIHKTTQIKHSPTHKPDHKTKIPAVSMPTPTGLTIQPTRVSDMLSTVVMEASRGTEFPSYSAASPGVSRTAGLVQPSTPATETPIVKPTQVLPTRTYIVEKPTSTSDVVKPSTTDKTMPPSKEPPTEPFNYEPILKNDIDRLEVYVGDILNYRIPLDTFYDFEDGDTSHLKLVFLLVDGMSVPPTSWIDLNQEKQILYGLPLASDEGRHEYLLSAIDAHGKIARDAFEVIVKKRPQGHSTHEFAVTLDLVYPAFEKNVSAQIEVSQKIAKLFGDNLTDSITVVDIAPGSVVFTWMNNSLPTDFCPSRAISQLISYLINASDKDVLTPALLEALKPIKVLKVTARPIGLCMDTLKHVEGSPAVPPANVEPARETSDEDVFITTVVPAVVIAAMLLLITCIVCMLYRKKRKGKLYEEDQRAFSNKGVPIIFADELDDKADPPTKPLIMTEEKPPLPPPEYQHLNTAPSTPLSSHKEPIDMSDDDEQELNSPPYQPPPPFTGSHGNRHSRRPVQPSYRNPPPYVPP